MSPRTDPEPSSWRRFGTSPSRVRKSALPAIVVALGFAWATALAAGPSEKAPAPKEPDRATAAEVATAPADVDPAPAGSAAPATPDESHEDAALSGALVSALDAEIDAVTRLRDRLVAIVEEIEERRRAEIDGSERALAEVAELTASLRVAERESAVADRTYDRIVAALPAARARLEEALDLETVVSGVPEPRPRFDVTGLDASTTSGRIERLGALEAEVAALRSRIAELDRATCWTTLERRGVVVRRLNQVRVEALERLTPARRSDVLGISREGIAQLRREAGHIVLAARLYVATRRHDLGDARALAGDVFRMGNVALGVFRVVAVLVVFAWAGRRVKPAISRLREAARRRFRRGATLRRADTWIGALRAVAPWSLFLVAIAALRWSLGPVAELPEPRLMLRVAVLYGLYRVGLDTLFAASVGLARHYQLKLDPGRTARLLRSVRSILRLVVGVLLLLAVSEATLGRGALYHVILRASWIVAILVTLHVVNAWRSAIADAYLSFRDRGPLANLVRRSRERWYVVFVAAASFVVLAGRGIAIVARDFVMGFDQTRRALAFLFRLRMEKRAERKGYADGDVDALPERVREAFTEEALGADEPCVEHFPGLDDVRAAIAAWVEHDVPASYLLAGERGSGKTSWLARVGHDGIPVDRIVLDRRVRTEAELAERLAEGLGLPYEGGGLRSIRRPLLEGPKRIATLDLAHNLFLGTVGGYDVFEAFIEFVEKTCERVFWVCGCGAFAWDHLLAARPELAVFTGRTRLPAWTEEQIAELIRKRSAAAGVSLVYDDVLAERAYDLDSRLEAQQAFSRLLWDYSDGNPRSAMHFWLRSLVVESGRRLRVRLFRRPDIARLDALPDVARFLLASIVAYENLSLREASVVTRYSPGLCHIHLGRLVREGVVVRTDGRHRVTTHWHREVVRFLRRRNLLAF